MIGRRLTLLAAVAVMFIAAACEKDPNEASTWIPKLNDPNSFKEAVRNLDRLKDPKAITPLGKAWKKWNKPSNALEAIINIAKPVVDKQGKETRAAAYGDAIPFLEEAVDGFDPSVDQSIGDATKACDALGASGDPSVIPTLVAAATKANVATTSAANRVKAEAIFALGRFKQDQAVDTLITILEAEPAPPAGKAFCNVNGNIDKKKECHKDDDCGQGNSCVGGTQPLALNAAAALALAKTGNPKALPALAKGMFRGPIYQQARGGISAVGKPAVQFMLDVFQGKQDDVNKFAADQGFDKNAPGAVKFKAALMLGDLRAIDAIPLLTAELKQKGLPITVHFTDERGRPLVDDKGKPLTDGIPDPTTQHNGVLDALRHLGPDQRSADAVWDYYNAKDTTPDVKPLCLDVYSMVVPAGDMSKKDLIWAVFNDDKQDEQLRFAALLSYARIARDPADAKKLNDMAADWDKKKTAADAKQDDDASDQAARFSGALKEAALRIQVIDETKGDVVAMAKTIEAKDVDAGKPGLPKAERALLELSRLGPKASAAKDVLLKNMDTQVGIVREMLLLTLPRVVAIPCDDCAKKMGQIIDQQSKQTTLDRLTGETRIVKNYFDWAGK
jgi:hypothetical protein